MISKKKLFFTSFVFTLILVLIGIFGTYSVCVNKITCVNILHHLFIYGLFFLPLFFLSLITYKMRDSVYQAWFRFVRWWIPLSILPVLISPSYGHGLIPVDKGRVSLALSALFLLISLVIILIKTSTDTSKRV